MKSAALGALATILGILSTLLYQDNYPFASYCLGLLAAVCVVFSLIALRKEKNTDKRPRLIVRNVAIKPYNHPLMPIENGKPLRVQWDIVNTGDSSCEITDGNSTILVDTRPFDTRSPYGKSEAFLVGNKLKPGDVKTVMTTADTIDFIGPPVRHVLRSQNKSIFFYGIISYRDDNNYIRRTAYCRVYDPETRQFNVVVNNDFEYSD